MFIDTLMRHFASMRRQSDKTKSRQGNQPAPASPTHTTPTSPEHTASASPMHTAPTSPTHTAPASPTQTTSPAQTAPSSPGRTEAGNQLSELVRPVSLMLQSACQPVSLLFMILIVETMVVLFSAVHAAYAPFFPALAFLTVYYQMVLFMAVGMVCHLSRVLARWNVAVATLAVVVITSVAATLVALAIEKWALGHTSSFALFIGQTQLSCLALALFFLRYRYLQQQRYEQLRAQINARLEALQAYIRPHFLFNSLNNLAAMIAIDAAKAEKLVLAMAYMLRYVLRASAVVSLGDEMEFLRRYIFIEQARLGDRLHMHWRLPEGVDKSSTLPSMIIQPLLENAVNHGPGALPSGGRVEVEFMQNSKHTIVYIRNHAPVPNATSATTPIAPTAPATATAPATTATTTAATTTTAPATASTTTTAPAPATASTTAPATATASTTTTAPATSTAATASASATASATATATTAAMATAYAGARRRPDAGATSAEHHHLSIANIRARLQLLYDDQAQLVCQAGERIDEERLWWQTELIVPRRPPSPDTTTGEPSEPNRHPSPLTQP